MSLSPTTMTEEARRQAEKKALSYRWVVWGIMVFAFMISFFHRFSAAVVKDYVTEEFAMSAASFGAMASMYFYAYMIMQIPVGLLADSLGARIIVSAGMFIAGAGSVIFGFAPSPAFLYVGRFLVGLGVSTVFVSIMKVQTQWFSDSEFATISGATTLVGNAGGVLSQGPLAFLISVISWRAGFFAIGALTILISALCWAFIRNRPQDMGLPPLNEREIARSKSDPEPFSVAEGLRAVIPAKGMLLTALFYLFNQAGCFAFISAWGIPWLVAVYGLSVKEASSYSVIVILGMMAGGFMNGWISDRMGSRKIPMLAGSLVHGGIWAVIVFYNRGVPPVEWMRVLFFFLGLSNSIFVLAWSVAKELTPEKYTGLAISVLNAASFLSIAILTSAMGWVLDLFAGMAPADAYRAALSLPLVSASLSFLAAAFVPETGRYFKK
ncbi:MAG: MFS transporter [Aminivibrio sp.]|jgi:sugar phosphate permease